MGGICDTRLSDDEKNILAHLVKRTNPSKLKWCTKDWCNIQYCFKWRCNICSHYIAYEFQSGFEDLCLKHAREHLKESNLLPFL